MAGPEAAAWVDMAGTFRTFDPECHLTRIENAVASGTPDVNCCLAGIEFWAELKGMRQWKNVSDDHLFTLDHELRESQRRWLKARWAAGGSCWVILGVRDPVQWLIWDGATAAEVIGNSTKQSLIRSARINTIGPFPTLRFLGLLRGRQR